MILFYFYFFNDSKIKETLWTAQRQLHLEFLFLKLLLK